MQSDTDFEILEASLSREIAEIDAILSEKRDLPGPVIMLSPHFYSREAEFSEILDESSPESEKRAWSHHDETRVTDAMLMFEESCSEIEEDEPALVSPSETPMPIIEHRESFTAPCNIGQVFEYFDALRDRIRGF